MRFVMVPNFSPASVCALSGGVRGGPRGGAVPRRAVGGAPAAARAGASPAQDPLGLPARGDGLDRAGLRARAQVEETGRQEGERQLATTCPLDNKPADVRRLKQGFLTLFRLRIYLHNF